MSAAEERVVQGRQWGVGNRTETAPLEGERDGPDIDCMAME